MPTITTRAGKGSALTHTELDNNFKRTVSQKTSAYTIAVSDNRSIIECNHASTPFTLTLPDAATAQSEDTGDFEVTVTNINSAAVTIARAGSDTINGGSDSVVLSQNESVTIHVNSAGTGWVTLGTGWADNLTVAGTLDVTGATTLGGDLTLQEGDPRIYLNDTTDRSYDIALVNNSSAFSIQHLDTGVWQKTIFAWNAASSNPPLVWTGSGTTTEEIIHAGGGQTIDGITSMQRISALTANNLHLDGKGTTGIYLNYYDGDNVYIGDGAQSIVSTLDLSGNLYASGTVYVNGNGTNTGTAVVHTGGGQEIDGTLDITGVLDVSALMRASTGDSTTAQHFLELKPTDYGTGKPELIFKKESTASSWTIGLWDDVDTSGTIALSATDVTTSNDLTVGNDLDVTGDVSVTGSLTLGERDLADDGAKLDKMYADRFSFSNTGNTATMLGSSGFTVAWVADGEYKVTHNSGTTDYSVVVSNSSSSFPVDHISKGSNDFTIYTDTGLGSGQFDFILMAD
jgi:hypothetical protein